MKKKFFLDIVTMKEKLFSGFVKNINISGISGELSVFPDHIPLLTQIKPGLIHININCKEKETFYISGGILEIQNNVTSILVDLFIRAKDLDKKYALDVKKDAEIKMQNFLYNSNKYKKIEITLNQAIAKLRVIEFLKKSF